MITYDEPKHEARHKRSGAIGTMSALTCSTPADDDK